MVSWSGFVIWVRVDRSLIYRERKYSGSCCAPCRPGRAMLCLAVGRRLCRVLQPWLRPACRPRGLLPPACLAWPAHHYSGPWYTHVFAASHPNDVTHRTTFCYRLHRPPRFASTPRELMFASGESDDETFFPPSLPIHGCGSY